MTALLQSSDQRDDVTMDNFVQDSVAISVLRIDVTMDNFVQDSVAISVLRIATTEDYLTVTTQSRVTTVLRKGQSPTLTVAEPVPRQL